MKKPLHVTLNVREPSEVDLRVHENVQLDRVVRSPHGSVAERRGGLLKPGVNRLALEPGRYFFKTLSDAHLRVVCGGVETSTLREDKDPPSTPRESPDSMGDDPAGEAPTLTVESLIAAGGSR